MATTTPTEAAPAHATTTEVAAPETTEQMIRRLASASHLDPDVMVRIARAESGQGLDPAADNPTSTADGLFQIIDGTWRQFGCQGSKKDAVDNATCAMKIASTSGLHHWDASRPNWSR